MFPSPRGDKLHLIGGQYESICYGFPSPRGDKLHHGWNFDVYDVNGFPSPRGDKLHPVLLQTWDETYSVSVPSRG